MASHLPSGDTTPMPEGIFVTLPSPEPISVRLTHRTPSALVRMSLSPARAALLSLGGTCREIGFNRGGTVLLRPGSSCHASSRASSIGPPTTKRVELSGEKNGSTEPLKDLTGPITGSRAGYELRLSSHTQTFFASGTANQRPSGEKAPGRNISPVFPVSCSQ